MFCRVHYSRHTANCHVLNICRVHPFAAHGKCTFLPCVRPLPCVFWPDTRQRIIFAVCLIFAVCFLAWHMAKKMFAVCQTFAVCCFYWHMAKGMFVVCPSFSTRRTFWHTAIWEFPVVLEPRRRFSLWWPGRGLSWETADWSKGVVAIARSGRERMCVGEKRKVQRERG